MSALLAKKGFAWLGQERQQASYAPPTGTALEAGCRRPYEATEPTASAHQRSDPVGIRFCTLRRHRV